MGINIPEVERQKASKALNCDRQCPLWVISRHCGQFCTMSALPPKADIDWRNSNVRLVPQTDIPQYEGMAASDYERSNNSPPGPAR